MWQRLIDLQLPQDEPDAEGTIKRFSWGLKDNVHRQVLSQDKEPRTMVEWQEAAQGEVHKIRKIIGAGLDFCSKQKPCDHGLFQTGQTQHLNLPRPTLNNNGIVLMEVDATQTRAPFAKLTDKERIQFRKEGCCFRCRQKGHMAWECPGRPSNSPTLSTTARLTMDFDTAIECTPNNSASNTPTVQTTTTSTKLTWAQQIAKLEEEMDDEERNAYLDTRDMKMDFYNAES